MRCQLLRLSFVDGRREGVSYQRISNCQDRKNVHPIRRASSTSTSSTTNLATAASNGNDGSISSSELNESSSSLSSYILIPNTIYYISWLLQSEAGASNQRECNTYRGFLAAMVTSAHENSPVSPGRLHNRSTVQASASFPPHSSIFTGSRQWNIVGRGLARPHSNHWVSSHRRRGVSQHSRKEGRRKEEGKKVKAYYLTLALCEVDLISTDFILKPLKLQEPPRTPPDSCQR